LQALNVANTPGDGRRAKTPRRVEELASALPL